MRRRSRGIGFLLSPFLGPAAQHTIISPLIIGITLPFLLTPFPWLYDVWLVAWTMFMPISTWALHCHCGGNITYHHVWGTSGSLQCLRAFDPFPTTPKVQPQLCQTTMLLIRVAWGWTWKCETHETRIKCLRKNPNHLTHTTHTLPQSWCKSSGPLILKNITCVLSLDYFVLLRVLCI